MQSKSEKNCVEMNVNGRVRKLASLHPRFDLLIQFRTNWVDFTEKSHSRLQQTVL